MGDDLALTDLINAALAGDSTASERAYRDVYEELRQVAHARLRRRSQQQRVNCCPKCPPSWLVYVVT